MNNTALLNRLAQQLDQLAANLAPVGDFTTPRPRFDRHLFRRHSLCLIDYLSEAQDNFVYLQTACRQNECARTIWLAEKLARQIAALTRESVTWSLRGADTAHLRLGPLHADILRHQKYVRRLQEMVADREQKVALETTFQGQQEQHRRLNLYRQRLTRCQKALTKLNRRLALMNPEKLNGPG